MNCFKGKIIQTPAMKYGLTKEIRTAKEYVDRGPNKKLHKSGLRVNSSFCWLGASPNGVVYDLSWRQNSFGIFEAKCPFSGSDEKLVLRNSKLGNITYSP